MVEHADEDARPAAGQGQRGNSRPFEQFPARLQQQSLLGIHRQGLAGAYTEQPGVELVAVVQEAAGPHVAVARAVRIVVEQLGQAPAAIGGEGGDRLAARADQVPQILRARHTAGKPAAHRHDRQRLVGGTSRYGTGRRGTGGLGRSQAQRPGQVGRQPFRSGVVEGHSGRQWHAGGPGEAIPQRDRPHRVQPVLAEGGAGGQRGAAEYRGRLLAHQVHQDGQPPWRRGLGEAPPQVRAGTGVWRGRLFARWWLGRRPGRPQIHQQAWRLFRQSAPDDLSRAGAGNRRDGVHALGHLVVGECPAARRENPVSVGRLALPELHIGHRHLTEFGIVLGRRGRVRDAVDPAEHLLDLVRVDVLPTADNQFGDPTGDEQEALAVPVSEISGAVPTGGQRLFGLGRAPVVPAHDVRSAHPDLTLGAGCHHLVAVMRVDEADGHPRYGKAARAARSGAKEQIRGDGTGGLGAAVAVDERHAQDALDLVA